MSETSNLNFSETLRNGLAVTIRALRAADRERVAAAVKGLDGRWEYPVEETVKLRAVLYIPTGPPEAPSEGMQLRSEWVDVRVVK